MQQHLIAGRLLGHHCVPALAVHQQASACYLSWQRVMQQQHWTLQLLPAQLCVWSLAACQLALLEKKTGQAERVALNL